MASRASEKELFWRLVLDEHLQSGLTVRGFCQKEGISVGSFYAWRRKIKKRGAEPIPDEMKKRDAEGGDNAFDNQRLIPVDVVDPAPHSLPGCKGASLPPLLEIVTPSGFTLRLDQHVEPRRLNALLGVIMHCQDGVKSC